MLTLLQFADSALPIGAQAHSFGLETLTSEGTLTVATLELFLQDVLWESGGVEALFCRAAFNLAHPPALDSFVVDWLALNERLGALRPARESRAASATLGRRFLTLALGLLPDDCLQTALAAAKQRGTDIHHAAAFGLVGGAAGLDETATLLAYLQQSLTSALMAAQKLLPIGQSRVMEILWRLQPAVIAAANRSIGADWRGVTVPSFVLLADLAGMRHVSLPVRLFIS
ncbi:MAG: hypothetical protein M3Q45_09645 [Chloroflexota bacterium]|nr:hypothetical protein [Chloroflexota bacterium]